MKIKTKKTMNEKELIKYLVDDESTTIYFSGISYDGAWLSIEPEIESKVHFEFKDVSANGKTFTVEVEEEITEDTVIPELVELYEDFLESNEMLKHENRSISEAKDEDACASQAFYIINDDLTMTLIWTHEKGLVE